jgi:hypothetical protein
MCRAFTSHPGGPRRDMRYDGGLSRRSRVLGGGTV